MDTVRLRFGHNSDSAPVRHPARQTLIAWHAVHMIEDILVVITELVQNVSQHTGSGGELRMTRQADAVLIEVFDSSPDLPRLGSADPLRVGGRGLLIVAAMARAWGAGPAPDGGLGKVVWAQIALDQLA